MRAARGDAFRCRARVASSEPLGVRFRLGSAEKADLEVRWPSGVVDKVPGVAANQVVKITEGKGMGAEVRVAAVIYRVPTFGSIFLASAISASASAVFFSCS